jgi:hypothetical protein
MAIAAAATLTMPRTAAGARLVAEATATPANATARTMKSAPSAGRWLLARKGLVPFAFVLAVALPLLVLAQHVVRVVRPLLLRLEALLFPLVLAHAERMTEIARLQS